MREETAIFYQDLQEKAITGRSARRARTHCGKGGPVRLPSDCLTRKQREALNGECRIYRLKEPMDWAQFLDMPEEHRITYIKLLRQGRHPSHREIGALMGVAVSELSRELKRLGLE